MRALDLAELMAMECSSMTCLDAFDVPAVSSSTILLYSVASLKIQIFCLGRALYTESPVKCELHGTWGVSNTQSLHLDEIYD